MYPLSMQLPAPLIGFACANDEAEHIALTEQGYGPAFAVPEADPAEADTEGHTVESVRASLDAAGVTYDKRWGLTRLIDLLPKV
jgi:hypothetical protein